MRHKVITSTFEVDEKETSCIQILFFHFFFIIEMIDSKFDNAIRQDTE